MTPSMPRQMPLRYQPSFEKPEEGEAETLKGLLETLGKIRETTYKDTGHAMRSVHVKSHGLLVGEFQVLDHLPPDLAQGLFATPATYPALMRLSTSPGDMLPDSVSTPRGCAIKVVGVKGERLPGKENAVTQDFVMVNGGPSFMVANAKKFLSNLKPLAAATDKGEGVKVALSSVMRGVEKAFEAVGSTSAKIRNMGGEPEKHILGERFFSQVPILFGDYMAKLSLIPVSPELKALTDSPLHAGDNPNILRQAVINFFHNHDGEWELRAQLCTDLEKMPIEDASVVWPEDSSPYLPIARLRIPRQLAWSEARSAVVDDGMAFSPWQGLKAHRPIGSIMRVRKQAYEVSAEFRALRTKKPVEEPRSLTGL